MVLKYFFRWFNASQTHGAMLLVLPASQSSWCFVIPKKIYEIWMKNVWNFPSISSRIFAFCIEIPMMMIKRYVMLNTISLYTSNDSQKWKGLFCGPFILQTVAAHLLAIEGSVNVPGLHEKPAPAAVGALGLASASVCIIPCA
jgi:hypothetical protein